MRNIITAAIVILIVVPAALYIGYTFVPGVRGTDDRTISEAFLFNSYLIFLGFFLTSAAIGPIVAQFVAWRTTSEWAVARRNAMHRLGALLKDALGKYQTFLSTLADDETEQHAEIFLDQTVNALDEFFEMYATEQVAFNAGMHGAASSIREVLSPLHKALATTRLMADRNRSHRAYIHTGTLNKFRKLLELDPLTDDSKLLSDAYFAEHGKLFVDLSLDRQLGAGSITVHGFSALNAAAIEAQWTAFCRACGDKTDTVSINNILKSDADTQQRLHARFVRSHVEESYLVESLLGK